MQFTKGKFREKRYSGPKKVVKLQQWSILAMLNGSRRKVPYLSVTGDK